MEPVVSREGAGSTLSCKHGAGQEAEGRMASPQACEETRPWPHQGFTEHLQQHPVLDIRSPCPWEAWYREAQVPGFATYAEVRVTLGGGSETSSRGGSLGSASAWASLVGPEGL